MSELSLYAGMELQRSLTAYLEHLSSLMPRFPGGFAELCEVVGKECYELSQGQEHNGETLMATRMLRAHLDRLKRGEVVRMSVGSGIRCDNVEEFRIYLGMAVGVITQVARERAMDRLEAMMCCFYEAVADWCDQMRGSNPRPFDRKEQEKRIKEFIPSDEPFTKGQWAETEQNFNVETGGSSVPLHNFDDDEFDETDSTLHAPDLENYIANDVLREKTPFPGRFTPNPKTPTPAPSANGNGRNGQTPSKGSFHASAPPETSGSSKPGASRNGHASRSGSLSASGRSSGGGSVSGPQFASGGSASGERRRKQRQRWMGQKLGRYELTEHLGSGASSHVYKSYHPLLDLPVAIKVLHDAHSELDRKRLNLFFQEARLSVKVNHPNAVRIFDLDEHDGVPFIVMEFVEGSNVKDLLRGGELFEEQRALTITLAIAQVLKSAYGHRIIHRDVKPENLIITPMGDVKVSDLGLAKIAAYESNDDNAIVGTPLYIAPEQIQNPGAVDFRADVYSLGGTLYHMLTGHPPFPGDNIQDLFEAHLHHYLADPRKHRAEISAGTSSLIMHMMEKRPERRHETYDDLIREIRDLVDHATGKKKQRRFTTGIITRLRPGKRNAGK